LKSNIFITGFSGTGKTTVSRDAARMLGFRLVDLDEEIALAAGKPIESIFADDGESVFRKIEQECLAAACERDKQVVSTGGGIVMNERNRELMERNGIVVCLEARPDTIYKRLDAEQQAGASPAVRPMLAGTDPLARIASLKEVRQANYNRAHWTIHTDSMTPQKVAEEVVRAWKMLADKQPAETLAHDKDLAATVRTSSGDYPVWVGWGLIDELGERVKRILSPQVAYIISDEGVYHQARRAQWAMEGAGIPTHMFFIPAGEQNKTLETVQYVYKWLADRKAERGHLIVAVGGGVVGDLAGFVAATYLRGMPFAQVPTSMLAMMDASIGGKVAVDMPHGKNLVGAFYQPKFVLGDVQALQTLPQRELTSGWAEAIKHGLILDRELLETFEEHQASIRSLEPDIATDVIRRSVAVKANVVLQDEMETLGIRVLLNYGHTMGHALEAATGYGMLLHGEAVSIGMMGAAYLGNAMGLMTDDEVERQRRILSAFGLPLTYGEVDLDAVNKAMLSDKKTSGGNIRWVLLDGIGNAITRNDVPPELVQETLKRLAG
jgi:3-dehydroquinate synthase